MTSMARKMTFKEALVYFTAAVKAGDGVEKVFESSDFIRHSLRDYSVDKDANSTMPDWKDDSHKDMESYFYGCAINSIYPNDGGSRHYSSKIEKTEILISTEKRQVPMNVPRIHYFLFPSNILIFSFECHFNNITTDDFINVCSVFRDIEHWISDDGTARINEDGFKLFEFIARLHNVYNKTQPQIESRKNYYKLLYKFNKLKTYSNIVIFNGFTRSYNIDNLLFETATLSPFGSSTDNSPYCPSDSYFNSIIENNTLSIFKNWKSIILTDSVVTVHYDDGHYLGMWKRYYFEYLYVISLYVKTYTLEMTDRFKAIKMNPEKLGEEFERFSKEFNFNNASFNFLPQLLYSKIREVLNISSELEWIKNQVDQHNGKAITKKVALLTAAQIFFLSVSFFNIAFPWNNPPCWLRTTVGILVAILVVIFFILSIVMIIKIIALRVKK